MKYKKFKANLFQCTTNTTKKDSKLKSRSKNSHVPSEQSHGDSRQSWTNSHPAGLWGGAAPSRAPIPPIPAPRPSAEIQFPAERRASRLNIYYLLERPQKLCLPGPRENTKIRDGEKNSPFDRRSFSRGKNRQVCGCEVACLLGFRSRASSHIECVVENRWEGFLVKKCVVCADILLLLCLRWWWSFDGFDRLDFDRLGLLEN